MRQLSFGEVNWLFSCANSILRKWVDLIDTPIEFWERNLTHLMRQYIGVAVHTLKPGESGKDT